jgi:dTDP-4-dehydrorhamnose 3,5-epimerase
MRIKEELLSGCFLVELDHSEDSRGSFIKTYNENMFEKFGVSFEMKEEYYSFSKKNVIRGMHYQSPPNDHEKIVICVAGLVMDVLLDLRRGDSYGSTASVILSGEAPQLIFIPKGIAHGFLSLENNSLMLYKTSTVHAIKNDLGIRWDSFGYNWTVENPILSLRDRSHCLFDDFSSPF